MLIYITRVHFISINNRGYFYVMLNFLRIYLLNWAWSLLKGGSIWRSNSALHWEYNVLNTSIRTSSRITGPKINIQQIICSSYLGLTNHDDLKNSPIKVCFEKSTLWRDFPATKAKLLKHGPIVSKGINVYFKYRVTLIEVTKIQKTG